MLLRSESERSVLPFVTNQHLIVLSSYRAIGREVNILFVDQC